MNIDFSVLKDFSNLLEKSALMGEFKQMAPMPQVMHAPAMPAQSAQPQAGTGDNNSFNVYPAANVGNPLPRKDVMPAVNNTIGQSVSNNNVEAPSGGPKPAGYLKRGKR
jgi:hypothetical protein